MLHHKILRKDANNSKIWVGNWIRKYEYQEQSLIKQEGERDKKSNRLSLTVIHPNAQQPIEEKYTFDLHGNMTSMPHLREMDSDFNDQLKKVNLGDGGLVHYVYDASGQRVRKVHEHGALVDERIYLGNFEIYRKYNGNGVKLERETLHIMDDKQRIALVETRTFDLGGNEIAPRQLIRYQLNNHLGSTSLELDDHAQIISYEEYTPYGSSAYQALGPQLETSKRYRYTGKERDDETGLYYNGLRYYASWLGRWISCDPFGIKDSLNLYQYVHSNPVMLIDPTGGEGRAYDPMSEAAVSVLRYL